MQRVSRHSRETAPGEHAGAGTAQGGGHHLDRFARGHPHHGLIPAPPPDPSLPPGGLRGAWSRRDRPVAGPDVLGCVELSQFRRGAVHRLGFALQLVTPRVLGTFLPDPADVPEGVLLRVVAQPACPPRPTFSATARARRAGAIPSKSAACTAIAALPAKLSRAARCADCAGSQASPSRGGLAPPRRWGLQEGKFPVPSAFPDLQRRGSPARRRTEGLLAAAEPPDSAATRPGS